jgi:acetoin utilization deacetylase AcuC-like enzyme
MSNTPTKLDHLYDRKITIHYRPEMSPPDAASFSKSPTKPRRFMEFLRGTPVWSHVHEYGDFSAVGRALLQLAHTDGYITAMLDGDYDAVDAETGLLSNPEGNGIGWSEAFRDSVLWTNGSLLSAIRCARQMPQRIHMAPVSGFHHARPEGGEGFCTFSGQVISAIKMYKDHGMRGAWIDLDGHFGNSIEDSRGFAPMLNLAIPKGCNINPQGTHGNYLADLANRLAILGKLVMRGGIDYICFAHGADSHEWDDLGSQCSTEEWLTASDLVYEAIRGWSAHRGKPIPVVLALFGGYRDDHPESVLGLHAMDAARALSWLGGVSEIESWRAEVRPRNTP